MDGVNPSEQEKVDRFANLKNPPDSLIVSGCGIIFIICSFFFVPLQETQMARRRINVYCIIIFFSKLINGMILRYIVIR